MKSYTTVQVKPDYEFPKACCACNSTNNLIKKNLNSKDSYICESCFCNNNEFWKLTKFKGWQVIVTSLSLFAYIIPGVILFFVFKSINNKKAKTYGEDHPETTYSKQLIKYQGSNGFYHQYAFANDDYANNFADTNHGNILSNPPMSLSAPSSVRDLERILESTMNQYKIDNDGVEARSIIYALIDMAENSYNQLRDQTKANNAKRQVYSAYGSANSRKIARQSRAVERNHLVQTEMKVKKFVETCRNILNRI